MFKSRFVLFAVVLFACCHVLADQKAITFSATPKEVLDSAAKTPSVKAADITVLTKEVSYVVDQQNRVVYRFHQVYRVESQTAVEDWSSISAYYSPWRQERPEVRVRVVNPDGSEHLLDPKMLQDSPAKDEQENVYDDNRVYQGPIPSVTTGSIIEEEIVRRDREPLFSAAEGRTIYFGMRSGPVEHQLVTVTVPAGMPFKHVSRLLPDLTVEKTNSGDTVEYKFEQRHMDMLDPEETNLPGDVPGTPYIAFATGDSWSALAADYNKIIEPKIRLADVEAFVKHTTKPGDSRDEIIRKLVAALHKDVRYTGVEFGEAAIVPAFPAETLKRGYGDCKDKSALLIAMLRVAGIPAHLALLETGPGDDTESALPAMNFDHAIVYVPGPPEVWIDATTSRYQVGPMPVADAGRLALVIREGTEKLVKIPELKPEDNLVVEEREVTMPEFGAATIKETSFPKGIAEGDYRYYYEGADPKETKDSLTDYARTNYLAEKLVNFSQSDPADMNTPFRLTLEMERARRGYTGLQDASLYIIPDYILERLPSYLQAKDAELTEKEQAAKEKKARTADFVFTPFITEWQYKVKLPIGFKVRALPENKSEDLGPGKLTYNYSTAPDGTFLATIRFNTVKGRYTAAEAEAMRAAIRQFRRRDAIGIGFDHVGQTLLAAGKFREGLEQYQAVAAKHPKEALHHLQLASAFQTAGMCETARVEARKATDMDPKSSRAYQMLGWVLEHDLVCRRFKKGFDYQGAVLAYKKAMELEPDETDYALNLAMLYEHGPDGYQYSPSAQLDDAVSVWRAIAKKNPKTQKEYENNLLFDLLYAKHFKQLQTELANTTMDATRKALMVSAVVGQSGVESAIEQSFRIAGDEATRSNALAGAANQLLRLRMYRECAELLSAAVKGQQDAAQTLQRAEIIRKTKRAEDSLFPETDPRSVVQRMMISAMRNPDDPRTYELVAPIGLQGRTPQEVLERSRAQHQSGTLRAVAAKSGVTLETITDMAMSNAQFTSEGDDKVGYRVTMQAIGTKSQVAYVVKVDGRYMLLAMGQDAEADLGAEVLTLLERNEIDGARKMLDWARSDSTIAGGDDPLAGAVFPRVWSRGQEGDVDTMRFAALSMIGGRHDVKKWIPQMVAARDAAKTDSQRMYMERALADAYATTENFTELRASAERLLKASPTSDTARMMLGVACRRLKDWETWRKAVEARLAILPDDPAAMREQSRLYEAQEEYAKANEILQKLFASGRGTVVDMNQFGWNQLLMKNITPEGLEQVRRGISIQKAYAIVHTLASMYAETGNALEARQLVLGLMDELGMDEPDDGLWYVFGRIAEVYGQPETAQSCYKRVQWKEKFEPDADATFTLAQQRLKGIGVAQDTSVQAK